MIAIILLSIVCRGALAASLGDPAEYSDQFDLYGSYGKAWDLFRKLYNKTYSSPDEAVRREGTFRQTFDFVKASDELFKNGTISYSTGINYFADLTQDEVINEYTGYRGSGQMLSTGGVPNTFEPQLGDAPRFVDWRQQGYVTPVKNQGNCGGCWAFSATGALEGQMFRKTGSLVPLSEQNLLDCATQRYGSNGCNGGQMAGAFRYVMDAGGLDTARNYPYTMRTNFQCQYRGTEESRQVRVRGFVKVPPQNEAALQEAVARVGPVSIAINASPRSFMFYRGGIYYEPNCNPRGLNHAVLFVGYGEENGTPYWIMKNSWGTGWGEAGYMRIIRNRNQCGIAMDPIFPTL
ncbi:procathepsin L-like [Ornithodoros turicata]|uniref:procathepsin L-like n=1 Tax=Ornithodoros turicata TaxID=34597 RepID=UPI003139DCAC